MNSLTRFFKIIFFQNNYQWLLLHFISNVHTLVLHKDDNARGMLVLSEITMTISSGTAGYESGLSRMNLQKTNIHTSLSNQSLNDITRIAIDGDPIHKFQTEDHANSWIANR